jgi:predicted DNA-binding transcriptional regulator AlpA
MILEIETPPRRAARAAARPRREPMPAWVGGDALVTAREAAALRRCSLATVWRDVAAGRLPPPIYLAPKRPRWRLADVLPAAPTAEAERIPAARAAADAETFR